jgi:hypothetical protein
LFAVLLAPLLAAVLVGCGPASGPTATREEQTQEPTSSPSEALVTPEPSSPDEPSIEPVDTPEPSSSGDPSASPSAGTGAAAGCTGTDENRRFFEAAAGDLNWQVYCAVLPSGWFVGTGGYRQAGGGRLEITYRGPDAALLELHEGGFCTDGSGCVPSGTEAGDASFGDQAGTLISTDEGGWAVVVEGGETISWLAVSSGLDEDAFRAITSALVAVDG